MCRILLISKTRPIPKKLLLFFFCTISCVSGFSQTIPVVFHIISTNPASITDLQIQAGLQDLNDAFAGTGAYAGTPGINSGIRFCLARVDPDGGISTGITRTQSELTDFDQDLEDDRLKKLSTWNTNEYCNIWLVDSVRNEYHTGFACGTWTRNSNKTYGNFLPGNALDGIVTTGFGPPLAAVMGSYLGLNPTFVYGSCTNNDCSRDGDGICDTPPSSGPATSCAGNNNSCNTDTLSGFNKDMPDPVFNFMSFTGYCTNSFTAGQAAKMRANLAGARSTLLAQNKCNPPCTENISASFTRDNWLPTPGAPIQFTATASGGANYQWFVDGVATGTNNPLFSTSFPQTGGHKVQLKVYNANPACFAGYSDSVFVTCGVIARFTADKRTISSGDAFLLDTIFFENRSVNAVSYQWWASKDPDMAPAIISTTKDLHQVFHVPGVYSVWLIATNGNCNDTSEKLTINVFDPTPDATIGITDVQCYQQTKIQVSFLVCNSGYDTIPAGTPVTFYDADPRTASAHKLDTVFNLPAPLTGNCCASFTIILDVGRPGLNQLYAVVDDNGTTIPIVLPNTTLVEKNFFNNMTLDSNFRFRAIVDPASATMEPGDTLQLSGRGLPGTVTSYLWSASPGLSCTTCPDPTFIAGKKDVTEKFIVTSVLGCTDSAFVKISVPVADDYTIRIDSMECVRNDSAMVAFTVCNGFRHGIVPDSMKVSFYAGDPATDSAKLLQPVFTIYSDNHEKCLSFSHHLSTVTPGNIYAVVNDNGISPPIQFPADTLYPEKDYTNNTFSYPYSPGQIQLSPADTTVLLNQSYHINIQSTIYDPGSILWDAGSGYTLSCTTCPSPLVTATGNGTVIMHTNNQYGCRLQGRSLVHIIPPDFTVEVSETHCYTNDSFLVKFRVCASREFDSLTAGIPVSFYDGNQPGHLLKPTFYTDKTYSGNCQDFTAVISSPQSGNLTLVVNDKGLDPANIPDSALPETNLANNITTTEIQPFTVSIDPPDTTVPRLSPVSVHFEVSGGQNSSFNWNPTDFISCLGCTTTVITAPHDIRYELEVKNEYNCIASAYANIKTFGPGKVSIPNAFSPNGDGRNEVFYIIGNQDVRIVKEFSVYNRWGQAVFRAENFQPNDPGFGWNGIVNGKPAAAEAYVYMAIIEFTDGSKQVFKGTVILVK